MSSCIVRSDGEVIGAWLSAALRNFFSSGVACRLRRSKSRSGDNPNDSVFRRICKNVSPKRTPFPMSSWLKTLGDCRIASSFFLVFFPDIFFWFHFSLQCLTPVVFLCLKAAHCNRWCVCSFFFFCKFVHPPFPFLFLFCCGDYSSHCC